MNITIGHDSEFGLQSKGQIVSALDHIKEYEGDAGRYFPDNMNCEIAINPVSDLAMFHRYTDDLLDRVQSKGFELLIEPTIKYPDEAMENPLAYISGCNPDFCAYTGTENNAPDFEKMDSTRSAGGHIHVGVEELDVQSWVRWMDAFVALPLLKHEKKNNRREMYGGAGAFRAKPYGGEYRTLSNMWIHKPHMREFVWNQTIAAVEESMKHDIRDVVDKWSDIPLAIDTHNLELADQAMKRLYIFGVKEL